MIAAMASPGQESESLNVQLLVDSMLAMVHTARPDGHIDYFNKRWLEDLKVSLRDRRGNNFHVKKLVGRLRDDDRTHAITDCEPTRASLSLTPFGAIGRNATGCLDTEFFWYDAW